MPESITESSSKGSLETYLKNVILEDRDKVCNYVELSAREILPITRRLFEEKVSLAYDFKISQIVEKERHLIIYGEAGSGKTSTLKWLSTVYARERLLKKEGFVPIYIALDSYVKGSFYNYLKIQVTRKGIFETDFKKLLEGNALLLLDGLDLLTPSENFSPFDEISDFISEYEACRYVITSRPEPSDSLKSTFALSELEKLTDENIRLFIEKNVPNKRQAKLLKVRSLSETQSKSVLQNPLMLYFWLKLSTAHMGTRGKPEDIQHFTLFDSIPSSRVEIYQALISELFKDYRISEEFFRFQNQLPLRVSFENANSEWVPDGKTDSQEPSAERIGFQELNTGKIGFQELNTRKIGFQELNIERTDIENVLMNLAFKLQCRNKISCKYSYALEVAEVYIESSKSGRITECSKSGRITECSKSGKVKARKLLQACLELGLLIRKRSEVKFGVDRTFQEYFAALKLKTYFENGIDISKAFRNPRWENMIMLTSDLLESEDELVNSMVSSGNLYLASKCAVRASPETKGKLCALLAGKLDSRYTVEKVKAVQSLGKLGTCGIRANTGALKDKDIRVKRETAKVLGETRSEMALIPLEAAVGDADYSVRIEAVKSLGLIGSERAIELLRDTFKDQNRAVRLEAANALMQIGSEKALEVLISALGAKDDFVRIGAVGALGRTNSRQVAEEALIKAFQDEDKLVRLGAAEALGRMRSERAVEPFVDALEDKDEFVRWIATKALGEIKSDKTSGTFVNMLEDKSRFVRREAAKALGGVGSEETLDPLVLALSDEDEFVRKTAVESLGEIKSEKAAKTLINKLQDNSHLVRLEAAKALGMMKIRKAIAPLLFALGDENRFVRKEAANALGQLECEKVLDPLIRIYKSQDPFTRQGAVRALGQINPYGIPDCISDQIFEFIDNALKDEDKLVRKETAKALQSLSESRSERAFESLISALDNEDDEVRRLAAGSLNLFDCEKAIPQLVSALKSRDATVRRFAADTLGQIKSKKALKPLIDVLVFDNDGFVKEEAAKALGKIKSSQAIEPLIDALMDQNNKGRSGAAEALGQIKAENAVDHLIAALTDKDDFTRLAAAKALGRIKPKKAIGPLINSLYDCNRFVKAEVAGTLKKICTEEDRPRLQALLDSEDEFTANLAFEILEGIEMEEILKTELFLEWE